MSPDQRREILSATATLSVAVGLVGVVFGVGAVAAGATIAQACVMSLLVFTGASQFSFVSQVAAGSTGAAAMGAAVLLAARNTAYGLAMSRELDGPLATRLIAAQLTIDESTAMATAQEGRQARRFAFWTTGGLIYLCWNVATLIGAMVGSGVDVTTWGLDVAFPAAFVAMLLPHLRTRRGKISAALGAAICLAATPFVAAGLAVLCAAAAVLIGMPRPRPGEPAEPAGYRSDGTMP